MTKVKSTLPENTRSKSGAKFPDMGFPDDAVVSEKYSTA